MRLDVVNHSRRNHLAVSLMLSAQRMACQIGGARFYPLTSVATLLRGWPRRIMRLAACGGLILARIVARPAVVRPVCAC